MRHLITRSAHHSSSFDLLINREFIPEFQMFSSPRTLFCAGIALISLAACGSSSGTPIEEGAVAGSSFSGARSGTFDEMTIAAIEAFDLDATTSLSTAEAPTTGSAVFNGAIGLEVAPTEAPIESFAGNLTLLLDFESGDLQAEADGFASIDVVTGTIVAPVAGELSGDGKLDTSGETAVIDFVLSGGIKGAQPYTFEALGGDGDVVETEDGDLNVFGFIAGEGASFDEKVDVDGIFLAESR